MVPILASFFLSETEIVIIIFYKLGQTLPAMETAMIIPKEEVANLKFPNSEVLTTEDEKKILYKKLQQATALGNVEHGKIKIYFRDSEGLKMTETTIWATGEKNIVLKHGITIPIKRIIDVDLI